MPTPKLTDDEISEHLAHLPGWTRQGDAITRRYQFADFARALEFVNAVGEAAEAARHHPDIDIRYNKVTLALTTHDSGGLTRRDVELQKQHGAVAGAGGHDSGGLTRRDVELAAAADGAADAVNASKTP